jgi:hypothetical protein
VDSPNRLIPNISGIHIAYSQFIPSGRFIRSEIAGTLTVNVDVALSAPGVIDDGESAHVGKGDGPLIEQDS